MTEVLQFALLGVGAGAIYALIGQGLVLIYRGSGVLNLAHGAFAMAGAFAFHELHTVQSWPTLPSVLVAILALAVIGAIVDQTLMRRLRTSSALARLIGTLAIFIVVQAIAVIKYGAASTLAPPLLSQEPVEILGATVSSDRLYLLGIAVVLTAVLAAGAKYSRLGWAMSAVAENQQAAAALGWSPERISAMTWAFGAGVAALAGILIAPITQLSVGVLGLLVIPALAAALVGRFKSFPLTLAGGLALGIAESEVLRYVDLTGASTSIPLLAIVVLLALRGSTLPLRGYVTDRLPIVAPSGSRLGAVVLGFVPAVVLIGFVLGDEWLAAVIVGGSVAIVLLSLVVLTGLSGQLSLAQMALAGIGALVAARLVASWGWSFVPAAFGGVVVTTVVGLLFALPALRTRGVELAVVTLSLGAAAQAMLFVNSDVTGSAAGTPVGSPSLLGLDLSAFEHPVRYALLVATVLTLCVLAVMNLRRGRSGRRLLATRTNERAAAAMGISVFGAKLYAFALAGALAGVGGILLAFRASSVVYDGFGPFDSITAVAQVIIGGIGYVTGPLYGSALAPGSVGQQLGAASSEDAARYLPLVSGGLLIGLLLIAPHGLAHAVSRLGDRLPRQRPRRSATATDLVDSEVPRVADAGPLRVQDLGVRYGGVQAVEAVSFEVRPGSVVGLIGPNGAGKTSIVDAISGFTPCSGSVRLGDDDVSRWPAHRRARSGLVRSFQSLELFEDMTVLENLQTAADERDLKAVVTDLVRPGVATLSSVGVAAIREFELSGDLDRRPPELSYGKRRLLAIARAVAMRPAVLLLDEPAAGLDEAEGQELATLVRRLADEWGIGVLVIEHDMAFVMRICDEVVVVDFGRVIASGSPADVQADERAVAAYLGEEPTAREVIT